MTPKKVVLNLLPKNQYRGVNRQDPIRYYYWPVIGRIYRKRVELCLEELTGGGKILEIGFGTGLSFLNLSALYQEIWGLDLTADVQAVAEVFKARGIQTILNNGDVMKMPYPDAFFDSVLLISILEHLMPVDQVAAFQEINRVLKPGGQVVYGVPVERPLMIFLFRMMGVNIREHHYSTEQDVFKAASMVFQTATVKSLKSPYPFMGSIYQIGHCVKMG